MTNNQLTENSVNQLLNNIRLARDNAERADNRVDHSFYYALTIALEELQERRKAEASWRKFQGMLNSGDPAASQQPAPVVPEEMTPQQASRSYGGEVRGYRDGWNACRASMLQSEPVTTANKLGNSPAQSPIDHGYRKGCECSGCKTTVRICAELAGKSPVIGIDPASGPGRTVEVRYVAPPGYVMVPKEPTESMINAWLSEVANWRGHVAGYKAMLAAAPQGVGDA